MPRERRIFFFSSSLRSGEPGAPTSQTHVGVPLLLPTRKASRAWSACIRVAVTQLGSSFITSLAASMTMAARNFSTAITLAGLCLCFLSLISVASADSASCPGPIKYYEEIGCTPVFKTPDSPCPEKYNCDHLKDLPTDKCVLNGHEYAIGESLKDEDANPCDLGCYCTQGRRGPEFSCAEVDCFFGPVQPGCYMQRNVADCCPGPEVCPKKPEDRPTCMVDGKLYKDGEYFSVAGEPNKTCVCGPGYKGENVEPFCMLPKPSVCGTMLRHAGDVREGCIPTYYHSQSPKTSCSVASRCQNSKDAVIPRTPESSGEAKSATDEPVDPTMMCKFGNLTMHVGDELNQATDYSSVCMKCVCEVPPVPTCRRLSDAECDVTKHPNFNA